MVLGGGTQEEAVYSRLEVEVVCDLSPKMTYDPYIGI